MVNICCVRRDGAVTVLDIDFDDAAATARHLVEIFGNELVFGGFPTKDQGGFRLEWLEASGDDLDYLKDVLVGAMLPRYEGGRPKIDPFRWYGHPAMTALGVICSRLLADIARHGQGA